MENLSDYTARRIREVAARDAVLFAAARLVAKGGSGDPEAEFRRLAPDSPHSELVRQHLVLEARGAVSRVDVPGLLAPQSLAEGMIAAAAGASIVGRLGAVPALFNAAYAVEDTAPTAQAHTAGALKPVTAAALRQVRLRRQPYAAIVLTTTELMRLPGVAAALAPRLAAAVQRAIDAAFVASCVGSPATAGGTTFETDLGSLLADYEAAGGRVESAVLVMSSRNAVGAAVQAGGALAELGRQGGRAYGVPVVAADAAGQVVALVDVSRLLVADQGEVVLEVARSADIEMSTDPENEAGSVTRTFQANALAWRCERYCAWDLGPVAAIASASYAAAA